jgi:hypothetical protein
VLTVLALEKRDGEVRTTTFRGQNGDNGVNRAAVRENRSRSFYKPATARAQRPIS